MGSKLSSVCASYVTYHEFVIFQIEGDRARPTAKFVQGYVTRGACRLTATDTRSLTWTRAPWTADCGLRTADPWATWIEVTGL